MKFLFVGRPTVAKGLTDLFAALSGLLDVRWSLWIVGAWTEEDLAYSNPVKDRCWFVGAVAHRQIPQIMKQADLVLVPSRYENFCNVALEAMAAGRPVLGARCGGIPDLVQDGINGRLFEPGNVADLERQLRRMVTAPEDLVRMGEAGWFRARRYSWLEVSVLTNRLLHQAIDGANDRDGRA